MTLTRREEDERVKALEAEVERLQGCNMTNIREQARLINERDAVNEALRRVVEALEKIKQYTGPPVPDVIAVNCFKMACEALAFAKGVSTPTPAHDWKTCSCRECNQRKIDEDYYGPAREYRADADRGGEERG